MNKITKRLFCVFVLCIFPFTNALADLHFPSAQGVYINDYAGVLSPADKDRIEHMLDQLEKQTGIQFSVVTIHTLNDYGANGVHIQNYADSLMDNWGVGDNKKNNGILLLFAQTDRKVAISMGAGYQHQYNSTLQNIVDNDMLPYFRQGEYSRGIYEGVSKTIDVVTVRVSWFQYYKWHLLLGGLCILSTAAGISCMRAGRKGWGWAFFTLAFVLLLFLLRLIMKINGRKGGFGGGRSGGGGASGSW